MHPVLWGVGQLFGIGRSAQLFITSAVMSSCDDIMMWVQPQLQWYRHNNQGRWLGLNAIGACILQQRQRSCVMRLKKLNDRAQH